MIPTSVPVESAPLRVGLVGCGAVSERYHLPALLGSSDVDVVACVDASGERARLLADRSGAPHAWTNHQELVGQVDLAVVAVPNAFHAAVAGDLLTAGVHVLVEKPMARSVLARASLLPGSYGRNRPSSRHRGRRATCKYTALM